MYFKMDEIQERTEAWIKKSWKEGRWGQNSVINSEGEIVDPRLKGGLRPTPVTRDLTWGVPVPQGKEDQGMAGKVLCTLNEPLTDTLMKADYLCNRRLGTLQAIINCFDPNHSYR